MAKRTVNWSSLETWERLVSSIIATDVKIDLRAAATYFGTTYDTLENRFRKLKKDAATLKAEANGEERSEATPTKVKSAPATPRKPKTPKKEPLGSVANGRVTKRTPAKKTATVKQEQVSSDGSPEFEDMLDSKGTSFDQHSAGGDMGGDMGALMFTDGMGMGDDNLFN